MAKAQFNPAKTETKIVEISPATITLELTEKEAQFLMSVIGLKTNGKILVSVFEALESAGVQIHPMAESAFMSQSCISVYNLEKMIERG